MRASTAFLLAAALAGTGCGNAPDGDGSTAAPVRAALPAGAVAKVGTHVISGNAVARIAAAQRVSVTGARDVAVRDAVFASEAEAQGLSRTLDVELATRGVLARRLMRTLYAEAMKPPITDEELAAMTERRWLDVDRPEGFRTCHAVVRFTNPDESTRAKALAIAEAIRAAVLPLATQLQEFPAPPSVSPSAKPKRQEEPDPLGAAFDRAAKAVPHADFEVRIEPLPPVAANARVLSLEGGGLDEDFARAAAALGRRGDISPAVSSQFGVHIILLLERIPAAMLSADERRAALRDDIVNERARAIQKKLLDELRGKSSVPTDADMLLRLIVIEP